jgi:RNA polymerase sigma factor (sigma-70 family)
MHRNTPLFYTTRNMSPEDQIMSFDLYAPALYKYAFCLCNNGIKADQIVGDVFARLHNDMLAGKVSKINPRSHVYQIAYRLLVGKMLDFDYSVPIQAMGLKYAVPLSPSSGAEDRHLLETVQRALQSDLTDDQRHVVILRFLGEFSLKETAAIMGKTVGNVKVIQNRAIATLRQVLGDQVIETRAITVLIKRMS